MNSDKQPKNANQKKREETTIINKKQNKSKQMKNTKTNTNTKQNQKNNNQHTTNIKKNKTY